MARIRTRALAALLLLGCGGDPASPAASTPAGGFDVVWKAFDQTYPYFGLKGVDWNATRAAFRPRAEGAADVTTLNATLVEMLTSLKDIHVALEAPNGTRTSTWSPPSRRNWDQALWQQAMGSNYVQVKPNLGRARIDGIPYIVVGSWNSAQFSTADLDAALEPFRQDAALIIDVRPNGGGNDALALDFARRFTDRTVTTEFFRFRTGPGPNDLGNLVTRTISPRGPWTFAGRVYVLSGRGVYSSNESFIAAMRELPRATIVGDTTGGGTANPKPTTYYQGWKVWISTWYATTPDGKPIEGHGIPPDIVVPWSTVTGRDPIIAAAVALAKGG